MLERRNGDHVFRTSGSILVARRAVAADLRPVEFHGERVDNHRVEEGYIYHLCDHELRFTFQPPQ